MNTGVFKQAEARCAAMDKKARSLQFSRSLDETKDIWSEFLVENHRFFSRLGNAMDSGSERGWFQRVTNERRSDDLLKYLEAARHADEHGAREVSRIEPSGLAIGVGGGVVHIDEMRINNGRIEVLRGWQDAPGLPLRVQQMSAALRLEPVENRGVRFDIPKQHSDQLLAELTPAKAAQLTTAFAQGKLAEARRLFG